MSSKTRTAAVVVVIVAFIAGILVGVAGDHFYSMRNPHRATRFSADRLANRLAGQLDLSAQQKTQVQQIIERHRAKIDATMNAVRPQVRSEIDATNAEIDAVLTPEQRAKFATLRMHMGSHRRDRTGTTTR